MPAERELNKLSFNGTKFVKSLLNSLIIPLGIIALVCLDFSKFIDVKVSALLVPAERELNKLSFNGGKFAKSSLNSLIIPLGIIALVCLDFSKFNLQNRR